jgi:hypothetical protein
MKHDNQYVVCNSRQLERSGGETESSLIRGSSFCHCRDILHTVYLLFTVPVEFIKDELLENE